jgi:hypothetical protein
LQASAQIAQGIEYPELQRIDTSQRASLYTSMAIGIKKQFREALNAANLHTRFEIVYCLDSTRTKGRNVGHGRVVIAATRVTDDHLHQCVVQGQNFIEVAFWHLVS